MAETHPATGVEQPLDPFTRMENLLAQSDDPEPKEGQPETPSQEAETQETEGPATDEVTPDDLPADPVEQPAVDAFEIVHNGTQVKLTREEAISLARQGFDYTQKTQAVAAKDRAVEAQLRVLSEVHQAQPYLMQERAQVAALEQQLGRYQGFNWVQLATEDPMGYPAERAKYDVLVQAYQQSVGQYKQKESAVAQHLVAVKQHRLAQEEQRVPDLIPEWKDPAKRQAGQQAIVKHFEATYGAAFEELDSRLTDAFSLMCAYKVMKYDQLVKGKAEKVKQLRTAPPVTVPGASSSGSANADKEKTLKQQLRKTGSAQDAMAVLLNRMK